jgi:hypothetical protein
VEEGIFRTCLQKLFIKTLEKKSPTKTPKKKKYFGIILQKSPTINNKNDYFYYDYDTQKFNFKLFEKNPYKGTTETSLSTKIN